MTFCKRVVKFDRRFSIVDLGEVTQTLQARAHMHIASFLPSSGFERDKARGNCRSETKVVWAYQRISDWYIESIAGRVLDQVYPVRVYTAGLAAVLAVAERTWCIWVNAAFQVFPCSFASLSLSTCSRVSGRSASEESGTGRHFSVSQASQTRPPPLSQAFRSPLPPHSNVDIVTIDVRT